MRSSKTVPVVLLNPIKLLEGNRLTNMNKLIVSASLVTLGATGLQAAYAPGLSPMETSKPWSVAATVRGFYDDNYTGPVALHGHRHGQVQRGFEGTRPPSSICR